MGKLVIRNEREKDHRIVEEITRDAFWNLYVPGADEHYLVHLIRKSPDYLPALSFVAELNGTVVGSIFFTKSSVIDEEKDTINETITFGPVSVIPKLHHTGIGSALIEHAKREATKQGYKAILIYGYPGYYERFGFRHAKEFGISNPDGKYPFAHMALELYDGALDDISGKAFESSVFEFDQTAAEQYDATFELKVKEVTDSQKVFAETASTFL